MIRCAAGVSHGAWLVVGSQHMGPPLVLSLRTRPYRVVGTLHHASHTLCAQRALETQAIGMEHFVHNLFSAHMLV